MVLCFRDVLGHERLGDSVYWLFGQQLLHIYCWGSIAAYLCNHFT